MSLNIKLHLDTRRQRKDDTFPLVMRIFYQLQTYNISLGYFLLEKEWDESQERVKSSKRLGESLTRLNNTLQKERTKVYDVFTQLKDSGELPDMSWKQIKARIIPSKKSEEILDFFKFIEDQIVGLKKAGSMGNASVYKNLQGRLKTHVDSDELPFKDITYSFLLDFERSFKAGGGAIGGLSVYMRTLRAVYNLAIKSGIVTEDSYPFKNYSIKNSKSVPKALSNEQFDKFRAVDLKSFPHLERSRDLFMASFYMRGMNWMDMAYLNHQNIVGENSDLRLIYTRRKTGQHFNMKVSAPLKEILDKYRNRESDFLLPILQAATDPKKYPDVIRNKRLRLNKYLKKIADLAEIPHFSIYAARHTYATTGKRRGVPTNIIQQQMGHATETMTQTYLDSFENSILDEYDDITLAYLIQ